MKKILSLILLCMLILATSCINVFAEGTTDYASELGKYGIMKGDPDGNMRLSDNLTRGEAVTLLTRLYGFEPETSNAAPANVFSDMENHWACNAAMIAKGLRIVDKTDGEAFNPDESIMSEEFIKMVVSLLGYNEVAKQRGPNHIGYMIQASQIGVTKGVNMVTGQGFTRENAAQILCNSLDIPIMEMTSFSTSADNRYTILNGKNGVEFRSLRTMLEAK
ncbi:MAG: S-layer homology domain-containing protein [Clostridia bacterium]|nr:S-layer homology domain-containing protein [Clostridia bacterium]